MKKYRHLKKLVILGLFLYTPFCSMAWGLLGHRIVGEIADGYLTKKARKSIADILGNESLAMCSNWADFIRSDSNYNYLASWHYINIPAGLGKNELIARLEADTLTDAYTKINFLAKELKNKLLPQADKVLYLRMLVHLVGDVHQPLHAGRPEDLGGNKIKVLWFNEPYNLHQLWDDVLISFQKLSYTEYAEAINFTSKPQRAALQAEPVSHWFYNSYLAAEKIYSDVKTNEDKLGYQYNFKYKSLLDEQLLKAGIHLAGILNSIFK
jgi:S1/P1 Nuclease